LNRSKERLTKCASGGHQKKRTREKRTTNVAQNCTTIVVLPSPRSLFSSIERRLDCRFPSAVGQRNQNRLKQKTTTPIQSESICQDDADVNSLSTYTSRALDWLNDCLKYCSNLLKSLIDVLLVSCRSLVDLLWFSCTFRIDLQCCSNVARTLLERCSVVAR